MKHADQSSEDAFEEDRPLVFGSAAAALEPNSSSTPFLNPRSQPLRGHVASRLINRHKLSQALAVVPAQGNAFPPDVWDRRENIYSGWTPVKNRLRTFLLRLTYSLAYNFAAPAVFSRQPFVRYPYMYRPSEIMELTKQLLSVEVPGVAVEVGCNQGWTTCFLVEALAERGVQREYVCIDTFTGFTPSDVAVEYNSRGKAAGTYDGNFVINDRRWLEASMNRSGYSNVSVHEADATTFDYGGLGKIAFALIDLDLYRPVKESLTRIIPHMAKGGTIVIDDCDSAKDSPWDGARQAFLEFCNQRNVKPEIACRKLGIIRT